MTGMAYYWVGLTVALAAAVLTIPTVKFARFLWRQNVREPFKDWIASVFAPVHRKIDELAERVEQGHGELSGKVAAVQDEVAASRAELVEHMASEEGMPAKVANIEATIEGVADELHAHVRWAEARSDEIDEDLGHRKPAS